MCEWRARYAAAPSLQMRGDADVKHRSRAMGVDIKLMVKAQLFTLMNKITTLVLLSLALPGKLARGVRCRREFGASSPSWAQ